MALFYFVNKNPEENGDHEVHAAYCDQLRKMKDPVTDLANLGFHDHCDTAVAAAKVSFPTADGCFFCCKPCHTR